MNEHVPTAPTGYRWTEDRIGILVREWKAGTPINQIADKIAATRSAVVHRAEVMDLGMHPLQLRNRLESVTKLKGALTASQNAVARDGLRGGGHRIGQGQVEVVVKVPKVPFLSRRFGWEPALKAKYRE